MVLGVQKLTNFVKNIVAMGLNFISRFYGTLKSLNEVTIFIMINNNIIFINTACIAQK